MGDALSELSAIARAAAVDDVGLVVSAQTRYQHNVAEMKWHLARALAAGPGAQPALNHVLQGLPAQRDMVNQTLAEAARDVSYPLPHMAASFAKAAQLHKGVAEALSDGISQQFQAREARASRRLAWLVLLMAGLLLAVGLVLRHVLRSVLRPVMTTVTATERIAAGDLSQSVAMTSLDEIGRVLTAIQAMQERLRVVLAQVQRSSHSVGTSAQQIARGNHDLSRRAENAALQLQQASERVAQPGHVVRSLALRSAAAASEIETLFGESSPRVESGTGRAREAGKSMQGILDSIRLVTGMIERIALDAESQASTMDDVVQAVSSIDRLTQDNASLVRQSATASEEVGQQAQELLDLVGSFRV